MIDAPFLIAAALAVLFMLTTWVGWSKAFIASLDLQMAEDEVREAHQTIDRQAETIASFPSRGEHGRFAKRAA